MVHAEKAQQNVSHVELSQPDSSRVDLSQRFVTHGKQSSFPSTETAKQTQPDIAHVKQASYPSATYPTATKSTGNIDFLYFNLAMHLPTRAATL